MNYPVLTKFLLGPNAPPDRMYLEPVNSSTIKVVWTPIPRQKAQGLIRGYKIRYVKSVRGVQGRAQSKSVFELGENKEGLLVSTLWGEGRDRIQLNFMLVRVFVCNLNIRFKAFARKGIFMSVKFWHQLEM